MVEPERLRADITQPSATPGAVIASPASPLTDEQCDNARRGAAEASFIGARIRAMSSNDERFVMPLYSAAEAARHLDVPASTFRTWAHGYRNSPRGRPPVVGDPIVTTVPLDSGVSIPFIGLAEGYVLAAIRRAGVPLQRIRPALDRLRDEFGIEHVLASRKLFTDGAEVLYDYAEHEGDTPEARSARELVVVRNDQRVFNEIVDSYLQRIDFHDDPWARVIHLPKYRQADVVVDLKRSFGAPIFAHGGVRLETVLAAFKRGAGIDELINEYGVPEADILDVVRVHTDAA